MYIARTNEVFYYHPERHSEELFLTVHLTRDCTKTTEEQARVLAKMLNDSQSSAARHAAPYGRF